MYILKQERPNRSSPFAPACFLSLYHSKILVSLVLNQVCHIRLFFSFALRVFSMKWSHQLSVFRSLRFVLPRFPWTLPPAAAFVCVPPISKRTSRNFPPAFPEETRIFRVLRHLSSNFSISITFDIGYECLLIKYMLKQYSRFRISRLLSNTSSIFSFLARPRLPPLHLSGL